MSYNNQSFVPQTGQGNLSAQFSTPKYNPSSTSAPRDIPGRSRRQSEGYTSYPPPGSYTAPPPGPQAYGHSPPGGYAHAAAYSTSPNQMPPMQMPMYGASPTSQPTYGASPNSQSTRYGISPQATLHPGQQPAPVGSGSLLAPIRTRSDSDTSHKSRRSSHSSDHHYHDDKHHASHKRRDSRVKSPKRPTLTDSVLMAVGGLKGAFDSRK